MGQGFVAFDGRVLESWIPTQNGASRLHIAIIGALEIQEGRGKQLFLNVGTTYGSGNALIPFVPEQRAHVEWLMQAIETAKTAWRSRAGA